MDKYPLYVYYSLDIFPLLYAELKFESVVYLEVSLGKKMNAKVSTMTKTKTVPF